MIIFSLIGIVIHIVFAMLAIFYGAKEELCIGSWTLARLNELSIKFRLLVHLN